MIDKEPLSRVAEFRPSARYARISNATTPQASAAATTPATLEKSKEQGATALDPKTLQSALSRMTEHVQNLQRALQFSVDEESGETVVRVVDSETKELIRQIPSEELLAIANRLRSTAGVLLAESV
jgi:flagellar protein FlaG